MKVLWVTNVPTAAASTLWGQPASPFGGWLEGSLSALRGAPDLEVVVAAPTRMATQSSKRLGGTEYAGFAQISRANALRAGVAVADRLLDDVAPDLIHIHGTEMPHSLSFATAAAAKGTPAVVSIQGLVSVYARHMDAFLPPSVVHGLSTRPWVRSDRVAGMRRSFEAQGRLERRTLMSVRHVIGRTAWDRTCTEEINSELQYHHCDETLRPSFYNKAWRPDGTQGPSILVGQGHYPIKGLHLLLQALPAVRRRVPDVVVTVTGHSPLQGPNTAYRRYLHRLIRDLDLSSHIRFVGPQSEAQMLEQYLRTSVVACPSVIENSPNSAAEAMLLGVPLVAAFVGGVPDMVQHGREGLTYQADAPYMLANSLVTILENRDGAALMAAQARTRAQKRHDPAANARRTMQIYTDILDQERGPR